MSETVLEARKLTRDFARLRALDGLSLEVLRGRVVALLGPNGAGKTTFLRLATGLLEPTRGTVRVLGRPSRALGGEVSCRVVSSGEGLTPPPSATLKRLIDLQAGASRRFNRTQAQRLCLEHELAISRPFGELSKGQKCWALGALALSSGAEVLFFDEPADGLDPAARRALYDLVRGYVNEGRATAVVATHIIPDIERVADDVVLIDRGRLVLNDSLERLREEVREVRLPAGRALGELGGVELIAESETAGERLAWVRCPEGRQRGLENLLGEGAAVSTVNLERLYLAVCGGSPATRQARSGEVI